MSLCHGSVTVQLWFSRGSVAVRSRFCRRSVTVLSRFCRGSVAVQSRFSRGSVAAQSRFSRDAIQSRFCHGSVSTCLMTSMAIHCQDFVLLTGRMTSRGVSRVIETAHRHPSILCRESDHNG